jgi:hypothetical protein
MRSSQCSRTSINASQNTKRPPFDVQKRLKVPACVESGDDPIEYQTIGDHEMDQIREAVGARMVVESGGSISQDAVEGLGGRPARNQMADALADLVEASEKFKWPSRASRMSWVGSCMTVPLELSHRSTF